MRLSGHRLGAHADFAPTRLGTARYDKRKICPNNKAQLPQSEKIRLSDLALPTSLGRAESRRRLKNGLPTQIKTGRK